MIVYTSLSLEYKKFDSFFIHTGFITISVCRALEIGIFQKENSEQFFKTLENKFNDATGLKPKDSSSETNEVKTDT